MISDPQKALAFTIALVFFMVYMTAIAVTIKCFGKSHL